MRYDAVIFDMGNTLVSYWGRDRWPDVLGQAIGQVTVYLGERDMLRVDVDQLPARVETERREDKDNRVRPLAGRLARIFGLSDDEMNDGLGMALCGEFLKPAFAYGRRYDDVLPVLGQVRARGLRTGILSNTPWGSPGELWREELDRHGLVHAVDAVVFCTDAGWRKPAAQPFELIMERLDTTADRCLFVGDDPRWDVDGPRSLGMDAVLICRAAPEHETDEEPIA
jgi:FMN phosphatase YigB (HAD superfamily)